MGWGINARMPHGTARAPYVRVCGQFTAHTARAVKKIEKKIFVHFHPSFPPVHSRGPPSRKQFFFHRKKSYLSRKIEGNKRNVFSRCGKVTKAVPLWWQEGVQGSSQRWTLPRVVAQAAKPIRKEVHTVSTSQFFCDLDNLSLFLIGRYLCHVMCQTYQ